MTTVTVQERRSALAVAGALIFLAVALAAIVRLGWATETRRLLDFGFAGMPARLDTAVSIFAHNARLLAAVFGAILVAQSPWLAGRDIRHLPVMSLLAAAVDAVLALGVAANVAFRRCARRLRRADGGRHAAARAAGARRLRARARPVPAGAAGTDDRASRPCRGRSLPGWAGARRAA